jgi:hypothetical protein
MRIVGFRRSGNNQGFINGVGLTGFAFPRVDDWSGTFHCPSASWETVSSNTIVTVCSARIVLKYRSVVYGEYIGHLKRANTDCYGAVGFDDQAIPGLSTYNAVDNLHKLNPAYTQTPKYV